MEYLKHLLGLCGESHVNLYQILFVIITLKLIYERNTIKNLWRSWWGSSR